MSQLPEINTPQDADAVRKRVVYAAATVANIRARVQKYGECYVDNVVFMPIWERVEEATGNLADRIRRLATEMRMNVDWSNGKDEAHFTRRVDLVEVVNLTDILPAGNC